MVTVNVPFGKTSTKYKTEIEQLQNTAKSTLITELRALGADVVDNDNKIAITPTTASFEEIVAAVEKIKEEFNEKNKDSHITFGDIKKSDGSSCSDYNTDGSHMRKRSPPKRRATGRKSPSKRR